LEVIQFVSRDNEVVLTAQVSGNFEGSPIPLDYHFIINDGKINMLSIRSLTMNRPRKAISLIGGSFSSDYSKRRKENGYKQSTS
jgi:hypothetical protein